MKAYLAGPIFTYGDQLRNKEWAEKIRKAIPGIDLYSPIENTDINGPEGKKKFAGSQAIANGDNQRLNASDILIACIDGDVVPSGTSAEIGKFHEKIERGEHKLLIGICTDNRQCYLTHSEAKDEGGYSRLGEQQYAYQNLYVTGLLWQCGGLYSNIDDVIEKIKVWIDETETEFTQLLPCKICGGGARIAIDRNHLYYGVCKECGFNLAGTEMEKYAIALWNYYNNPRLYEKED